MEPKSVRFIKFHTQLQAREFPGGGGGTLGISGGGCAAGTLEPLTYTRASSAEFCYPKQTNPPYPRVAVFQKLIRSLAQ